MSATAAVRRLVRVVAVAPLWMACNATAADASHCLPSACQVVSHVDSAGACVFVDKADGTGCDDDNSCTVYDTCRQGVCRGGTVLPDGSACDDEDACTQTDTCTQGVCQGGNSLVCGEPGTCGATGSCDPRSGCSYSDAGPCAQDLQPLSLLGCSISAYTVPMRIGGSSFAMLLDSGSSSTAVAAGACSNCNAVTPRYQATNGVDQKAQTSAGYVDGSGWYAAIYRDGVQAGASGDSFGPSASMRVASITKQIDFFTGTNCFSGGSVEDVNGYQGILGLGPDGGLRPNTDSFVRALAQTGAFSYDAFALQLCHVGGRIWFGGYDPAAAAGSIVFTPILSAQNGDANHYSISLEDIRVGDQAVGLDSFSYGSVMVDSGTSATYLPKAAYDSIKQTLLQNANVKKYLDARTFETDDPSARFSYPSPVAATPEQLDAVLPWLTLIVPSGGPNPSNKLVLPPSKSYLMPWKRSQTGRVQYLYSLTLYPSDITILGASVLKQHLVVFDRDRARIGFLPQGSFCSSDLPISG